MLTNSTEQSLLEKLTGSLLVEKFPAFYGTHTFITAFCKSPPPVPIPSQINPVGEYEAGLPTAHLRITTIVFTQKVRRAMLM
jgi:hypothetical protein